MKVKWRTVSMMKSFHMAFAAYHISAHACTRQDVEHVSDEITLK